MTTECTSIQRALAIHRPDHPLPGAVGDHLAGCVDCRRLHEEGTRLWQLLDDYSVPAPTTDLVDDVVERVVADQLAARRRPATGSSWRAFAAAAALVIAAGAGIGGWLGTNANPVPHPSSPARDSLVDHAEVFGATPPGSLGSAYASLERGEVAP